MKKRRDTDNPRAKEGQPYPEIAQIEDHIDATTIDVVLYYRDGSSTKVRLDFKKAEWFQRFGANQHRVRGMLRVPGEVVERRRMKTEARG